MTTTKISDDEKNSSFDESDEDSSSSCPFKPEIAAKLTAAFAKATGIDFEVAVDLLNVHRWDIDEALAATYEAKERAQTVSPTKENYLRIISWNVDLPDDDDDDDESNELIQQKVETIVEILLREKPEIIFLQRVGTFALTLIITSLASFYQDESIQIDPLHNANYISIFTRKSDVKKLNVKTIQHESQCQMLKIEILYKNSIHFDLFNAFLDEKSSEELCKFLFDQMNSTSTEHFLLSSISSKICESRWNSRPAQLVDVWESIGKPSETSLTFDPKLNSNINENGEGQRDNRLFFRCATSSSTKILMKPVHLEFQGIQRLKTSNCQYASTRWALQAFFDLQT